MVPILLISNSRFGGKLYSYINAFDKTWLKAAFFMYNCVQIFNACCLFTINVSVGNLWIIYVIFFLKKLFA